MLRNSLSLAIRGSNSLLSSSIFGRDLSTSSVLLAESGSKESAISKRPANPYVNFVSDNFHKIAQETPVQQGTPMLEVSRKLGAKWKTLPPEEKQGYLDDFQKRMAAYKEEWNKLSQQQQDLIYEEKQAKKKGKIRGKLKKELQEAGYPARPGSAYNLFMAKRLPELKEKNESDANLSASQDYKQRFKQASSEWATLSQAKKAKFHEMYAEAKASYGRDVESWRRMIIDSGNNELLDKIDKVKKSAAAITAKVKERKEKMANLDKKKGKEKMAKVGKKGKEMAKVGKKRKQEMAKVEEDEV